MSGGDLMGMMQYGLLFAGISSIALGLLHIPQIWAAVFPQWDAEISGISLLNRKLINTVLIALCLSVVALGSTTILLAVDDLPLGRLHVLFLFFCFLFWLWRTVWQILYFPYRTLKPGPRLFLLHIFFIIIFVANAVAYLVPVITLFMA